MVDKGLSRKTIWRWGSFETFPAAQEQDFLKVQKNSGTTKENFIFPHFFLKTQIWKVPGCQKSKQEVGGINLHIPNKKTNKPKKTRSFPTARVPWVFGSPVIKWTRKLPQADVSVTSTGQKIHFPQDLKLFLGTQTEHNTKVCCLGVWWDFSDALAEDVNPTDENHFHPPLKQWQHHPPTTWPLPLMISHPQEGTRKVFFFSLFFTPWNWQK